MEFLRRNASSTSASISSRVTPNSATLSVVNLSGVTNSLAIVGSDANQTIMLNYNANGLVDRFNDRAGLVKIGDVAGQGLSVISAGGNHTMVAGSLLIQGGATPAANSFLTAPNTMLISTLYGPVQLKGGSDGGAYIDPALLNIVSNGSVLMQAGTNSTANASITAGTFNLAATTGDLNLVNSTTSPATASITANSFAFAGPGNVNLSGGTITVATTGTIDITGTCNNCSTNLLPSGSFTVNAYVPPPTDFTSLVTNQILTLTELTGLYEITVDEDGNLILTGRRLNQCY